MVGRARRDLQYLMIAAMLISGLYVSISGLVTDLLGLHQFVLHRYAGYACSVLIMAHLALNWERFAAFWHHRLLHRERPAALPRTRVRPSERRGFLLAALAGVGGFLIGRLTPGDRGSEEGDLGLLYHQWSKPGASGLPALIFDWGLPPQPFKT
jgi:hypothetical protein